MTDLTREQIEEVRRGFPHSEALSAICDMALRTLDAEDRAQAAQENWSLEVEHLGERLEQAEDRIRELEAAIRNYLEPIASEDWTAEDQMLKEVLLGITPPDSEPAEGEGDMLSETHHRIVLEQDIKQASSLVGRGHTDLAIHILREGISALRALAQSEQWPYIRPEVSESNRRAIEQARAEDLARAFHATYETLAPQYGYEMIAVCRVIRERMRLGVAAAPEPGPENGD